MNLISSPLTLASHNLSSSLQDLAGYSYCQAFYGSFPQSGDCIHAIDLLEKGPNDVSYEVHSGVGPHSLPLSKSYGTCMIQIDVAGPRLPKTFSIEPDTIRQMADEVLNECVTGPSAIGGFATSDLQVMKNWITAEETKLDRPFPTSTAFLTVTLTNVVPDWLSPGNYDPAVAFLLSQVALIAIDRVYTLRERIDLRKRATRLLKQGERMEPRGSRVPWWENPDTREEVKGTSLDTSDGTVSIEFPKPLATDANTATSKRRRRTRLQ